MAKGRVSEVGERVGEQVNKTAEALGEYLKEQRLNARLSLRQLAEQAGVSNPYLSQIERGLRKPSAEVLQQIAKAMRISAESLYVRAGILHPEDGVGGSVELAVLGDTRLTERQKQSLLDVYASFLALNGAQADAGTAAETGTSESIPTTPTTTQKTPKTTRKKEK